MGNLINIEMTPEEYFKKWAENCRIFIDYKPIHSHEDMMKFAKDYHTEQLRRGVVSQQRELLIAFAKYMEEDKRLSIQGRREFDDFLEKYSN
jgi:hypothetical protein